MPALSWEHTSYQSIKQDEHMTLLNQKLDQINVENAIDYGHEMHSTYFCRLKYNRQAFEILQLFLTPN